MTIPLLWGTVHLVHGNWLSTILKLLWKWMTKSLSIIWSNLWNSNLQVMIYQVAPPINHNSNNFKHHLMKPLFKTINTQDTIRIQILCHERPHIYTDIPCHFSIKIKIRRRKIKNLYRNGLSKIKIKKKN